MQELNKIGESGNHSGRYGARIRLWVLHTEEGNQSAQGLHEWMKRNGVSYHYVARGGVVIDIIDTDRASWSVLDANPYTINLCFAGSKAAQSRQLWLTVYGDDIDNAALLFVQDAKKYALQQKSLTWDEIGEGKSGATDHYGITMGLGIGNHTDVGPNFPWDVFNAAIYKHSKGVITLPPVPVEPAKNAIEEMRKIAEWLGAKQTTELELTTPDGRGRYVKYEHGHIYWTPETGAIPIPSHLFETYAELGWEAGALGYPVNHHTVLPEGDVQAFEKGVLYRKYGQPGFYVHGLIGARWMRAGFENSTFGWPVGNEVPFEGGAYQDFEHGRIVWSPDNTVALQPNDGPDVIIPDRH